jgi:hypothetical protein
MFAILCTEGLMTLNEIETECVSKKWVPILIFRKKQNDTPCVPVFQTSDIAIRFVKKNLPKNWINACVYLNSFDYKELISKNWILKEIRYPQRIDFSEFSIEIFELKKEPDFRVNRLYKQ